MEWKHKISANPKNGSILVFSKKTGNFHVVYHDYGDWVTSETDEGSSGDFIDFDYWMELPKKPFDK